MTEQVAGTVGDDVLDGLYMETYEGETGMSCELVQIDYGIVMDTWQPTEVAWRIAHGYTYTPVVVLAKTEHEALVQEVARLKEAVSREMNDIEQALGVALNYPRYCDDQANFPNATEADGVCVGEHTAASLAMEAAQTIGQLREAGEVTIVDQWYDFHWEPNDEGFDDPVEQRAYGYHIYEHPALGQVFDLWVHGELRTVTMNERGLKLQRRRQVQEGEGA